MEIPVRLQGQDVDSVVQYIFVVFRLRTHLCRIDIVFLQYYIHCCVGLLAQSINQQQRRFHFISGLVVFGK